MGVEVPATDRTTIRPKASRNALNAVFLTLYLRTVQQELENHAKARSYSPMSASKRMGPQVGSAGTESRGQHLSADPAVPDMAWVLRAPADSSERERRSKLFQAHACAAAAEGETNAGKLYQLAFWPDDKRAMPGEFIACALFSALQGKDAEYVERQRLASVNGLTVIFTGKRLTQVHADVWEAIMHMGRQQPEGSLVRCTARQLLRLMGRQTGGKQRDDLDLWLNQLTATSVVIRDDVGGERFRGSLLPRSADKDVPEDTAYAFDINRDLARILSNNLFLVDWDKRRQLQRKPLASWLQRHFSRFHKPVAVAELYRLSDSKTKRLVDFRKQLRVALCELQQVNVIGAWSVDSKTDTLRIMPPGKTRQDFDSRPILPSPSQAALFFTTAPAITADTRFKFTELYPGKDVDQCLTDFLAWLSKSGRTADKPNAAFLGFARKWAADATG